MIQWFSYADSNFLAFTDHFQNGHNLTNTRHVYVLTDLLYQYKSLETSHLFYRKQADESAFVEHDCNAKRMNETNCLHMEPRLHTPDVNLQLTA